MNPCSTKSAAAFLLLVLAASAAWAEPPSGRRDDSRDVFLTDTPACRGTVILGRPTDRCVTLSMLMREHAAVAVMYGRRGQGLTRSTGAVELKAQEPREVTLDGLEPNTSYDYRVVRAATGEALLPEKATGTFHTCRSVGEAFTFTVQADSHLDGQCLPSLYRQTLANAVAARPDFHIDLGDTFMTGKHDSRETAALQYAAQRYYLGLIGHSAPVFLVLGNHDGEEQGRGGSGLAQWACLQRKSLFPNPEPDSFYTGNAETRPGIGVLQDYYAFTWGDALFIMLDPYWTSQPNRGGKEPWNMSIGKAQYDWLARTLRTSKAKFKFVFIHQLAGGIDRSGRGGVEAAGLYEWGGREKDGANTFASHRPGWEKPIHSLLVETGVSVVFHGHDHFFARQEKDGIAYQLVPQPAHRSCTKHQANEYGYRQGHFLPGSGCLAVTVTPAGATVAYIRSALPGIEACDFNNGETAHAFAIPGRR